MQFSHSMVALHLLISHQVAWHLLISHHMTVTQAIFGIKLPLCSQQQELNIT